MLFLLHNCCLDFQTTLCYTYPQIMDTSLKNKVVSFLKQVGLNTEQSQIYLFLQENGPSSVLSISRGIKTGRTKLYPELENMINKQVIAARPQHYGTSYEALPPENLEFLVSEYERKASVARHNLTAAVHAINEARSVAPSTSKIIEYRGIDGLKQANYNLLKADGAYYVLEQANLDQHGVIPKHFVEKLRQSFVDKQIMGYDLTNNPNWKMDTKVSGLSQYSKARYIDPKVFEIKFETYVYNNVVTMLSYDPDDILCIEIHNAALAAQQKQLYQLLWNMGKDLKT